MHAATYHNHPFQANSKRSADTVFAVLIAACAIAAALIMVLVAAFIFGESLPLIREIGISRFFLDQDWWPREQQYNLVPMLAASIFLTLGAVAIVTPLSIAFSVFCVFYAGKRIEMLLRRLVDISAAIPTVIYGFWGLLVIVPLIAMYAPPGASLLAGIVVLALMIFPTVTVITHSAIMAVPDSYISAGTALGLKRSALIYKVVLQSARPGILSAVVLGAARAIGETMVVLMVCGNIVQVPASMFDPVRTLTANIALEMPYAMDNHRASLYVSGLMVLLVVTCLTLLGEIYAHRQSRDEK